MFLAQRLAYIFKINRQMMNYQSVPSADSALSCTPSAYAPIMQHTTNTLKPTNKCDLRNLIVDVSGTLRPTPCIASV